MNKIKNDSPIELDDDLLEQAVGGVNDQFEDEPMDDDIIGNYVMPPIPGVNDN